MPTRRLERRLAGAVPALALTCLVGCTGKASRASSGAVDGSDASSSEPFVPREPEPEGRAGMAWIPPGVLLAGTPLDRVPRIADEEMGGEQVVLHGFYVDLYPYPNEVGAIPSSNLTRDEAKALCAKEEKRLCTELELERACKGPANTTYEYGDTYRPQTCGTQVARALVPNGLNAGCQSAFGVADLHGSVASWTASAWLRDERPNLVTIRGGNGGPRPNGASAGNGELVSRCAHGRGVKPDARREDIGVRCCAGPPNTFEVTLSVKRGDPLHWQPPDDVMAPKLLTLVPPDVIAAGEEGRAEDRFRFERLWTWHPLGNEELRIGGGCAKAGKHEAARCGVVIARFRFDVAASLAWVATEYWQPAVGEAESPREIFLYGGDRNGAFRRRVSYAWGRIAVSDKERKHKVIGREDPTW